MSGAGAFGAEFPSLNCIDMSKWGGDFTAAEAACCAAAGVRTVIIGTGPGGYSTNVLLQADDVVAAGLRLEAYTFLEWGFDERAWIDAGWEALGAFRPHVRRIWIDVEDTSPGPKMAERAAYVWSAVARARERYGVEVGIYSGGWYWRPQMADTAAFAHLPLWNSYYDGDPDIDGLPYGGWSAATVAIEQFQGTTDLCGQSVDLNWLRRLPAGESESEEDDMELRARVERLERILAANGVSSTGGEEADTTGEAAIEMADERGWSLALGLSQARSRIATHVAEPHAIDGEGGADLVRIGDAVRIVRAEP